MAAGRGQTSGPWPSRMSHEPTDVPMATAAPAGPIESLTLQHPAPSEDIVNAALRAREERLRRRRCFIGNLWPGVTAAELVTALGGQFGPIVDANIVRGPDNSTKGSGSPQNKYII